MHICNMCLSFVHQYVSIAVAFIIRVNYHNIRDTNEFFKMCKLTAQFLQRMFQTHHTVAKTQAINSYVLTNSFGLPIFLSYTLLTIATQIETWW